MNLKLELRIYTHYFVSLCAERKKCGLQIELSEVQNREMALRQTQEALQGQLDQLQAELSQCREELETSRLQLSKTSVLNHTLERKNKVISSTRSPVRYVHVGCLSTPGNPRPSE